jgi:hypothetical protein
MTVLICVEKRSVGTDGSNTEAGLGPDGISKVEQPKNFNKNFLPKNLHSLFFFFFQICPCAAQNSNYSTRSSTKTTRHTRLPTPQRGSADKATLN